MEALRELEIGIPEERLAGVSVCLCVNQGVASGTNAEGN
jgi:hypothetical protein